MEIELKAYAKINLGLDVTGLREDGYHLVRMVMQSVGIHDILRIKKRDDDRIVFTCSDPALETGDNLCVKAAEIISAKAKKRLGADIRLIKNNPVAAGMAGGSTDAAAVLVGLNSIYELGYDNAALRELGVSVGADVPFCIEGGTALCEGIGEIITPISPMAKLSILIAKPDRAVSTAGIYGRLDSIGDYVHPDIDALMDAIESGDNAALGKSLGNVLENVTMSDVGEIAKLKEVMTDMGAYGALMTGSGPTVFGLFADLDMAEDCKRNIEKMGICSFLEITEPVPGMM